jgi:hypothetical protein
MSLLRPVFRRIVLLFALLAVCVNLGGCYFVMHEKVQNKMEDHEGRIMDLERRVNDLEKHQSGAAKPQP